MPATKTKKTTYTYTDGPLPVLYSTRVRLNDEQREVLKNALNDFRRKQTPDAMPAVLPGSTIQVQTNQTVSHNIYSEFGLSDLIVSDLVRTRETIPLNVLLNLQRLLGVVVIERKELEERFNSYLDYLQV